MKTKDGHDVICLETNKKCFTKREAGEILNGYSHHHSGKHIKKIPKRRYTCVCCGYYHLTSKSFYDEDKYSRVGVA